MSNNRISPGAVYAVLMILGCFILISFNCAGREQTIKKENILPADTFPVPHFSDRTLFYIQRTHNTNTIIYELNINKKGVLDVTSPVKIFWIRYAEKKDTAELSYIQNHYAYGIESKLIDTDKKIYKLNFVSYSQKNIYLMKSAPDNRYHAYISINGKLSVLYKIFVKIDGGSFWLPKIRYVEITGREIANGKTVSERFIP